MKKNSISASSYLIDIEQPQLFPSLEKLKIALYYSTFFINTYLYISIIFKLYKNSSKTLRTYIDLYRDSGHPSGFTIKDVGDKKPKDISLNFKFSPPTIQYEYETTNFSNLSPSFPYIFNKGSTDRQVSLKFEEKGAYSLSFDFY